MYFSFHFQHHYSFGLLYPKNGFQNNDLGICKVHLIFPVKKTQTSMLVPWENKKLTTLQ